MRRTLSMRLFSITIGILLVLMGCTLLFQLFFFQQFYEDKKVSSLVKEVSRFSSLNSYKQDITNGLFAFENNTSAKMAIFTYDKSDQIRCIASISDIPDLDKMPYRLYSELIYNDTLIKKVMASGSIQTRFYYNRGSGMSKIGVICPFSHNSKNDSFIVAVSPIQPIEEATSVIEEFYIYIFVGYLIISLLLSFIFTNIITKPLVKINNIAKQMSNMDFSIKCQTNRNDEIGNLARTLNFLSSNLEKSLDDLKQKNKKLELDIEKERNLELMRKDFIASVSHELKTPIGIIEGYAEGIKDGVVSAAESAAYLETIIDESKKMGILVSNMLELSKLESGYIKPNLEVFNINRLIKKVIDTLSINAEEKNLSLRFYQSTEYSYVEADIFQMEQVMTNLVTNAIKYTSSGNEIFVDIYLDEQRYKISVINKGTQIKEHEIGKLFNKFYRVDKARQRTNNSTGLGLSIVKNLLELHNFEYSLQNTDLGVEFKFYIPCAKLPEPEEE